MGSPGVRSAVVATMLSLAVAAALGAPFVAADLVPRPASGPSVAEFRYDLGADASGQVRLGCHAFAATLAAAGGQIRIDPAAATLRVLNTRVNETWIGEPLVTPVVHREASQTETRHVLSPGPVSVSWPPTGRVVVLASGAPAPAAHPFEVFLEGARVSLGPATEMHLGLEP